MNLKTALPLFLLLFTSHELLSQIRYYKGNTHTHSYPQSSDADVAWTGVQQLRPPTGSHTETRPSIQVTLKPEYVIST